MKKRKNNLTFSLPIKLDAKILQIFIFLLRSILVSGLAYQFSFNSIAPTTEMPIQKFLQVRNSAKPFFFEQVKT